MGAVRDFKTGEEVDPFDAAYRRVRAEYDAAKRESERFGGPCETCRYHSRRGDMFTAYLWRLCTLQTHTFEALRLQRNGANHVGSFFPPLSRRSQGLRVP